MRLDKQHAMVVLSGGQDSTTCLGWALENFETVSTVTFDYGQRHDAELNAAALVVHHFQVATSRQINRQEIALGAHVFAGTSPLTDPDKQLELYTDHDSMAAKVGDRVESTFVPMRNAVFLMLAANRAVVAGASALVTGVCQEDNANYPDCRDDFIIKASETIELALGLDEGSFSIETPLMFRSKRETVELALRLPHTYSALALSHTAYDGQYPPVGKDHASILRAHGFEQAGVPDPLVMRAVEEGLMPLPATANYHEVGDFDLIGWNADTFAEAWREDRRL